MDSLTETSFLIVSAALFIIGAVGVLIRRDPLIMFMCIEMMLNAVNLTFVAFSHKLHSMDGQIFVFFVMTVAAAEVAIGLAIIVAIFRATRNDQRRRDEYDARISAEMHDIAWLLLAFPLLGFVDQWFVGSATR